MLHLPENRGLCNISDLIFNRWVQPDSIIPETSQGVQAWDRYAYANNNPVRYKDPSGHQACADAFDCSAPVKTKYTEAEYLSYLSTEYGWIINKEEFSYREVRVISKSAQAIRNYASSQTAGNGKGWMNKYLRPIFAHNFENSNFSWVPLPGQNSRDVFLSPGFAKSANPISHVTHELGHVLDNATDIGNLAATWDGGGWGDALARYAGINPTGFRSFNGTTGIREGMAWRRPETYGNKATAEYFASTFEYAVNNPQHLSAPSEAILWLNVMVSLSMTQLP